MDQWHLTLSSSHRLTFFPTEQQMRAAVRTIDRIVGELAAMFCVVDDHVHVWFMTTVSRVGFITGALRRALGPLAAAVIDVVHHKPIAKRSHQRSMVGYLLDQLGHHRIDEPPALWSGACYQDLIGARRLERFRPRIRRLLPRLSRGDIDRAVGVAPGSLREATPEQVRRAASAGVVEAAAAALAVGPKLVGRARPVTLARRAACHVATAAGIRQTDLSEAMELPTRTIRRLLSEPAEPDLLRAVRLQLGLRSLNLPGALSARPRG